MLFHSHPLRMSFKALFLSVAPSFKSRSTALQAASGRYGEEIVVPGGKVSVSNPTGKVTTSAATLRRVPASS